MGSSNFIIRKGNASHIPQVLDLIKELAEYEQALDNVHVTEDQLLKDGFGPTPLYEFLVALEQSTVVGLSLFYNRYSTWKGKGLYLEDLVVTKSHRGQGIGKALIVETAKFAKKTECTGLYWQVLGWNTPAIEFYKSLGARFEGDWDNCKLDQESLERIS